MVYHIPVAACGTQLFQLYRIAIYFQVYLSSPPRPPKGMPLKTEPHPTLPCIVHLNSACTGSGRYKTRTKIRQRLPLTPNALLSL